MWSAAEEAGRGPGRQGSAGKVEKAVQGWAGEPARGGGDRYRPPLAAVEAGRLGPAAVGGERAVPVESIATRCGEPPAEPFGDRDADRSYHVV